MFGFTEAQIAAFGLTFGVGPFMLYMRFIIGHLAWEAKAGKPRTFVLFMALGFGMRGFEAKLVIQWLFARSSGVASHSGGQTRFRCRAASGTPATRRWS